MIIYTDGSRIPGQTNQGYAGIGIWFGKDDIRNTSTPITLPNVTNQLAELMAILQGLSICKDCPDLTIRSDSKYSINSVTVWPKAWIENGWKNSKGNDVANSHLIKDILKIVGYRDSKRYMTTFEHVYAHRHDHGNNGADKLATRASLKYEKHVMKNVVYFYNHNHGAYRCFSQFFSSTFTIEDDTESVTYNCAEQYYQHQKALFFNDYSIAFKIMGTSDPNIQKKLGRCIAGFNRDVWLKECYDVCRRGTIAEYSQHHDLLQTLLSTKGNLLAEASPTDCIWGIGISAAQSKAKIRWKGSNLLGKVLMDVRDNVF